MNQLPLPIAVWLILDDLFFNTVAEKALNRRVQFEGPYPWFDLKIAEQPLRVLNIVHPDGLYGAVKLLQRRGISDFTLFLPAFHFTPNPSLPDTDSLLRPVKELQRRTLKTTENGLKTWNWELLFQFDNDNNEGEILRESLISLTNDSRLLNCSGEIVDSLFTHRIDQISLISPKRPLRGVAVHRGWIVKESAHGVVLTKDNEVRGVMDEWAENLLQSLDVNRIG